MLFFFHGLLTETIVSIKITSVISSFLSFIQSNQNLWVTYYTLPIGKRYYTNVQLRYILITWTPYREYWTTTMEGGYSISETPGELGEENAWPVYVMFRYRSILMCGCFCCRCQWMRSMWRGFGFCWKMPFRKYRRKITQGSVSRSCTGMRTQWCCISMVRGCTRAWKKLLLSI